MEYTYTHWKRNFIIIWIGQTVSLFTSAIAQYALLWYLTAETGSAAVLSLATLLGFLPTALLSPFIGSFVDRYSRKAIMLIADGSIAAISITLAIIGWSGTLPLVPIMIALLLRALGTAFHQPCLQAVTPLIVPPKMLTKCNGYTNAFMSISLIFSPAIAAVLFAALPIAPLILLDALGAVIGMATIAIAHIPRLKEQAIERVHVVKDALEGLSILRKNKGLFYLVLISGIVGLAVVPVSGLYPLMSMDYFGGTATHAGIVESVFAVGMLLGSVVLGIWGGTKNKMLTLIAAVLGIGAVMAACGLLPPSGFVPFVILSFFYGFLAPYFETIHITLIQEQIAPEYLGRVIGLSLSIMTLAAPVGLALSGFFAEAVGIENWFILGGVLTLIAGSLCLLIPSVRYLDKSPKQTETNQSAADEGDR